MTLIAQILNFWTPKQRQTSILDVEATLNFRKKIDIIFFSERLRMYS